jgi:hypothetical protein
VLDDHKAYFNRRKFQNNKTGIAPKINEVEESLSETEDDTDTELGSPEKTFKPTENYKVSKRAKPRRYECNYEDLTYTVYQGNFP